MHILIGFWHTPGTFRDSLVPGNILALTRFIVQTWLPKLTDESGG